MTERLLTFCSTMCPTPVFQGPSQRLRPKPFFERHKISMRPCNMQPKELLHCLDAATPHGISVMGGVTNAAAAFIAACCAQPTYESVSPTRACHFTMCQLFYARRFAFYAGARLPSAHPYQGAAFALAGQSINASNALSLTRTMRRLMGFQGSRPTCPHPGHLCVPQTSVV